MALIIAGLLLGIAAVLGFISFAIGAPPHWLWFAIPGGLVGLFALIGRATDAGLRAPLLAGRGGVARLDRLGGTAQNDDGETEYDLDYTIALDNGRVYQHTRRTTRPESTQLGTTSAVVQEIADRPNFRILPFYEPTKGQLARLAQIEQAPPWPGLAPQPIPPSRPDGHVAWVDQARPRLRGAVAAALGVVAFITSATVTGVVRQHSLAEALYAVAEPAGKVVFPGYEPTGGPRVHKPLDPTDATDLAVILAELEKLAGTNEAAQIVIYPTSLGVQMPVASGADKWDDYNYNQTQGFTHGGATSIQPDAEDDGRFTLDLIDPAVITDVIARAPQDSGFTEEQFSHAVIDQTLWGPYPEAPIIHVFIGDDYASASLSYDLAGQLLEVNR